ncbi:MAG: M23/M56 family metallopeptidase [Defluviitaleaceae bacterium]|nr:M23/M56 family metallopeptidase [Defluviitaleaceae bacterium]
MNILLEMSLAGSLLIIAIILIRALLMHRLPKKTFVALWFVALFQLLVPLSMPSQISIFNLMSTNSDTYTQSNSPMPQPDISHIAMPDFAWQNQGQGQANFPAPNAPSYATINVTNAPDPLMVIYLSGLVILAVIFVALYIKNHRELAKSLPISNSFIAGWLNKYKLKRRISIRISDKITTPLTYGVLNPTIILPKDTDWVNENELNYVLAHELIHIKRFDASTKLILVAALCIHWFNPLVWVMYFLFNRDMEISCDEAVINMFGKDSKQSYALTLINAAQRRNHMPALHNYFSKYAIEERIKAIMKMKNKTIIGTIAAVLVVVATATVFATTRAENDGPSALTASTQTQFEIDVYDFINGVPDENVISAEKAAQIAADMLTRVFGAELDGITIQMAYSHHTWSHTWNGMFTPHGSDWAKFNFSVDAETGELISIHYSPWNDQLNVIDFETFNHTEPTMQQNDEFARLAMDISQRYNLLDSTPKRARLVERLGVNPTQATGEPAMIGAIVAVQCESGNVAILSFYKFLDNAPALTSITFESDSSWKSWLQFEINWIKYGSEVSITEKPQENSDEVIQLPFQWPLAEVGQITSGFGQRIHPETGRNEFHTGLDIAAQEGAPILAARDGHVTFSGEIEGFGNTVIIYHGDGYSTLYAHNLANHVTEGQFVHQGEHIADVGSTGASIGSHLHFELRLNDTPIDPYHIRDR